MLCFWVQRQRGHVVSGENWSRWQEAGLPGRLASPPSVGSIVSGPFQGWGPPPSPPGLVVMCARWGALVCLLLSENRLRRCLHGLLTSAFSLLETFQLQQERVSRDVEGGRVAVPRTESLAGGWVWIPDVPLLLVPPVPPGPAAARPLLPPCPVHASVPADGHVSVTDTGSPQGGCARPQPPARG